MHSKCQTHVRSNDTIPTLLTDITLFPNSTTCTCIPQISPSGSFTYKVVRYGIRFIQCICYAICELHSKSSWFLFHIPRKPIYKIKRPPQKKWFCFWSSVKAITKRTLIMLYVYVQYKCTLKAHPKPIGEEEHGITSTTLSFSYLYRIPFNNLFFSVKSFV